MSSFLDSLIKSGNGTPGVDPSNAEVIASNASIQPGSPQPLTVNLFANSPIQLPILNPTGVTIINDTSQTLTLGTEPTFTQNPVSLKSSAVLPWPTATTIWAVSSVNGSITILPGLHNYYDPNVISTPAQSTQILDVALPSPILNEVVALPSSTVSLFISVRDTTAPFTTVPTLSVQGTNTGFPYFGIGSTQNPYLRSGIGGPYTYFWIVQVDSTADPTVTISAAGNIADNLQLQVFASPNKISESDFYSSSQTLTVTNALLAPGSVTIITGPARILTVELEAVTAPTAIGQVTLGQYISLAPTEHSARLSLPDGTIQRVGFNLTLTSSLSTAVATLVSTTYP